MITFDDTNVVNQRFPFRNTLWNYVLKNLQPQHLLKLYQCCKFFYAKYRRNIIRNLVIVDKGVPEMFTPNKTIISALNPALNKLIYFWISDSFIYNAPFNLKSMPFFYHCTIKKLEACDFLIWDEYETLTKAGTVQELKIGQVIRDDDLVPVEELIATVPNATSIEICECKMTSTTFLSMAALNHQVKIKKFILKNMTSHNIIIDEMETFLLKHADSDCFFRLSLKLRTDDHAQTHQYNEHLKEYEKNCNKAAILIFQMMKLKTELEKSKEGFTF